MRSKFWMTAAVVTLALFAGANNPAQAVTEKPKKVATQIVNWNASPEPVRWKTGTLTFEGDLVDATGRAYKSDRGYLTIQKKGCGKKKYTNWKGPIKANGHFLYSLKGIDQSQSYRLVWSGDSKTLPSNSKGDFVKVFGVACIQPVPVPLACRC